MTKSKRLDPTKPIDTLEEKLKRGLQAAMQERTTNLRLHFLIGYMQTTYPEIAKLLEDLLGENLGHE